LTIEFRPFGDAALRVTLLGDGFGECVIVETAERIAVVDSALGPDGEPLPLAYLKAVGRSVNEVDLVVATHFDLDHVLGLAKVVRVCGPKRFVISGVFHHRDLLAELARDRRMRAGEPQKLLPSRSVEYLGAMEAAADGALLFLTEGTRCRRWQGEIGEVVFEAWAPAAAAVHRVHRRIASLMDAGMHGETTALNRAVSRENETSIVLSVRAPGTHLLLGGDLEATTAPTRGWVRAVDIGKDLFAAKLIDVVKVAHHGSGGAVDDAMWALASSESVAMLAPWVRGSGVLPSQEDTALLCQLSNELWLTIDPETLPVGPGGGRMTAPRVCWVQATYEGASWSVSGGRDSKRFPALQST
jgi:hypothetical protein